MVNTFKRNGSVVALVAIFFFIGAYFFSTYKHRPVSTLENFELPRYGGYDNKTGKFLILYPIKAIIDPNIKIHSDDQILGYGLLGTSLINTSDENSILGYRSFFLGGSDISALIGASGKMEASFLIPKNIYLIEPDLSIAPTKSIIAKREAVIFGVAFGLTDRYTYQGTTRELVGNDDTNHILKSDKQLKNLFISGNQVFDDLKNNGYEDLTLKYALGTLNAALKNDKIHVESIDENKFGTPQVYVDALTATIAKYAYEPVSALQEQTFLKKLSVELMNRGVVIIDTVFFKKNSSSDKASTNDDTAELIKIIGNDIDAISK